MIEPTDVSTCDDRQVKNKSKPLTKNKEGETRKMNSKSINHWKLATLFVVGLMAVVGMFAEDASSALDHGRISNPSPSIVKEQTILKDLQINYTFAAESNLKAATGGLTGTRTEIVVTLPEGWSLPNAVDPTVVTTTPAGADVGKAYIRVRLRGTYLSTVADLPGSSSLTDFNGAAVYAEGARTVTIIITHDDVDTKVDDPTTTTVDEAAEIKELSRLLGGQTIAVTFYKVQTAALTDTSGTVVTGQQTINLMVSDEATPAENAGIIVQALSQSDVSLNTASRAVKRGAIVPRVDVTYRYRDAMVSGNEIEVMLPADWAAAYPPYSETTDATATAGFGADVQSITPTISGPQPNKRSYVLVTAPGLEQAAAADGKATYITTVTGSTAEVTVAAGTSTVPSEVGGGTIITFSFYNVRIPLLPPPNDKAEFAVTDTFKDPAYAYTLSAGVSNPALATVTPSVSNPVISSTRDVTVTYVVTDPLYDETEVSIGLPGGWAAAFSPLAYPGSANGFGNVVNPVAPTGADRATSSYVEVTVRLDGTSISGDAVNTNPRLMSSDATKAARIELASVVSIPILSINRNEALKRDDRITVVFRNVMLPDRTGDALFNSISDMLGTEPRRYNDLIPLEANKIKITVLPPTLSDIRVTPHPFKEKSTDDIKVTYEVRHPSGLTDNAVSIALPSGLTTTTFGTTFREMKTRSGVTTLPPEPLPADKTEADYQYVTVTDTVAKAFTAAPALFDQEVTFTGDMPLGGEITVTYHNAVISELPLPSSAHTAPNNERKTIRDDFVRHIKVRDSAVSHNGSAYETDAYKRKIRITTAATNLSFVSVAPKPVKGGEVRDMVVTYTAQDVVYGNTITIGLPNTWKAAYANDGSASAAGFGSFDKSINLALTADTATAARRMVSTKAAALATGASASKTSYVTVEYSPRGASMNTAEVEINVNEVMIPVIGDMKNGDGIVITYHNVQVPELDAFQLANRPPPDTNIVIAQFTVTDKITGAIDKYETDAQVTVEHPNLSDIQVTPKMVKEGSIINRMTVTYTANDIIYSGNQIFIRIPEHWDPAYPSVSPNFVNETSLLPTADKLMTSYMRFTPRPANMDLTINSITSDGVDMMVNGDMGNGNRITVAFYNVRVREVTGQNPSGRLHQGYGQTEYQRNSKCGAGALQP